ncbi:MAG: phosphotransferase [Pseudomonadota bacterium]
MSKATSAERAELRQEIARGWVHPDASLASASSDASFRSYWRISHSGETHILMDAPPPMENCAPFVDVAGRLARAGVHAPEVLEKDLTQGFLLLEDLGNRDYLSALTPGNAAELYAAAVAALLKIQHGDAAGLPDYDEALLRRELNLFPEWLLDRHLGWTLNSAFYREWSAACDLLVDNALGQPRVLVHRDYHSRNLMLIESSEASPAVNPGVIDFQDAVLGPVTYDVVSLFRDCYVAWPRDQVDSWLQEFRLGRERLGAEPVDPGIWQHWCDLMSVQRHLKAAGIFCRLNYRDGKDGYLADIPRTLGYVRQITDRHPALSWLGDCIDRTLQQLSEIPGPAIS